MIYDLRQQIAWARVSQSGKSATIGRPVSGGLPSLGIMGAQLRAPLKPLKHHDSMVPGGLRGELN